MNFTEFSNSLQQMLVLTDANGIALVNSFMPRIIEYSEGRLLRRFDFLATRTSDITQIATAGVRSVAVPSQFIVLEGAAVITPVGVASPSAAGARRIPMIRADRSFLDMIWPNESETQAPSSLSEIYYSLFSEHVASPSDTSEPAPLPSAIQIAPTLDAAYRIEFTGTQRPAPLSGINPTTFISTYLPDLFLIAAAIAAHGYLLRNWSGMADDAQAPLTWEKQFEILARDVDIEELRRKSRSLGGSNLTPTAIAGMPLPAGAGAAGPGG